MNTPRTDAMGVAVFELSKKVTQLETELAAMTKERDKAYEMRDEATGKADLAIICRDSLIDGATHTEKQLEAEREKVAKLREYASECVGILDLDDNDSYAADDHEGAIDTAHAILKKALEETK